MPAGSAENSECGPRIPLVVGGAAIALGGLALTGLTPHTPIVVLLGIYALFGLGFGMANAPITNTAVAGLPRAQAGVAAAFASTSRVEAAAVPS